MKRILHLQKVSITYANGFCAAHDISFAVTEGECLAIVGESGSGKTTIARAALGLLPVNTKIEGSIRVLETEVVGAGEKVLRNLRGLTVGFVAQDPYSNFNPLTRIYNHIGEAWRVHALEPPKNRIVDRSKDLASKLPQKRRRCIRTSGAAECCNERRLRQPERTSRS
jgi:ABC-type glutathione transport system ATPase component